MTEKVIRGERVSDVQKNILLDFMEQHTDFAKGKFIGVDGKQNWSNLWEVLREQLNNVDGPKKSTNKWQRVWSDLKNKTKRKAAEINNARRKTGGGPQLLTKLTDFEERLVSFLGDDRVYGLQGPDGIALESEEPRPRVVSASPSLNFPVEIMYEEESNLNTTTTVETDTETEINLDVPQATVSSRPVRRALKRKRKSAAESAADEFKKIGEDLNSKIDTVIETMKELVEERKETNKILRELTNAVKNLNQK